MLSTKSGATFNLEAPNMTFAVRKDVIEIVYKVKPGVFQIVNLSRIDAGRGMLFMNWGDYFRRLSNEKAQMPNQLEKRIQFCHPGFVVYKKCKQYHYLEDKYSGPEA